MKNVVGWALVSFAAILGLRIMWLWNRVSPVIAGRIVGIAEKIL